MAKRKTTDPDPTGPDADTPAAGFDLTREPGPAGGVRLTAEATVTTTETASAAPAWPPTSIPFACEVDTVRGRRRLFWVECIETAPAGHFTGHINQGIARGWVRQANVPPGACHPLGDVSSLLLVE